MSKTYIDSKGYLRYKDSNKLVHRVQAEKMLGRKLFPEEVVHHKDRNKLNNSFGNLHVFPNQKEHDRVHKYDAFRFGERASYMGFGRYKRKEMSILRAIIITAILLFILWLLF